MAALAEVSGLHGNLCGGGQSQHNDERNVDSREADEELGRSYVCSMSSAIDLECVAGENYAELTLNVQRYLSRIVEELHLISAWSSSVYQPAVTTPNSMEGIKQTDDRSSTAMARLAVVTDMELMRRDVTKAQHELFQRCTSQVAYLHDEVFAAGNRQDTLYHELKHRVDDQNTAWDQQAQAIQVLEKARTESHAQISAMTTTLRHVQQQTSTYPTRLSSLEKSLASLTKMQAAHGRELQTCQGRVDSLVTTHQMEMEATRGAVEGSLAELRSAYNQLSAKVQVLRLEMQELNETTQKRTQHLLKPASSVATIAPGKSLVFLTGATAPPRPSSATPRTPRSGGNTRPTQIPATDSSSVALDSFFGNGGDALTETDVMAAPDCFIYAKAALPYPNSPSETTTATKKSVATPISTSRSVSSSFGANLVNEMSLQDAMVKFLTVQRSVMSVPLGYEDSIRPATAPKPPKDNLNATDRPDPLIPTRLGARRHKTQVQTSRSYTKP